MRFQVTYPYRPASLKVVRGSPRPRAAISARFSTLPISQGFHRAWETDTHAFFIDCPHFSMTGVHLDLMFSAWGTTLGAFRPGNCVSYGGFSLIFQKNLHLGSGLCAVMSRGCSEGSRRAITFRQGSSTAHLGFSVFSRVTPTFEQMSHCCTSNSKILT